MANYKFQNLAKTALWWHFMDMVVCFHPLQTITITKKLFNSLPSFHHLKKYKLQKDMNFLIFEYTYVLIGVFVGPTYSKPKKQFKTKFYKRTPWKLKLMKFEKNENLPTKWNWNLKKPLALPHLHKIKKRAIPIWKTS
jgi:hypothetical protein